MALVDNLTPRLLLDLDRDGTYESDQTAYLLEAHIRRGRDNALAPMQPGQMTLKVLNADGRWYPEKGVLSGLDDGTPVQLDVQWATTAIWNMDENPSAETDAVGASAVGASTVTRDITDSWVGDASFKCVTPWLMGTGIEKKKRNGNRLDVTGLQPYIWSLRTICATAAVMKVQILWYDDGAVNIQTDEAEFTFGDGWINVILGPITAPLTAVTAALRVVNTTNTSLAFWLDASFFYSGSDNTLLYVDGDQPGCFWGAFGDETPHENPSYRASLITLPQFTGVIDSWEEPEQPGERTATLTCIDRLGLTPQEEINLGCIINKPITTVLNRVLDRCEGELCSNDGAEWTGIGGANPLTNFSAVNGATIDGEGFRITPAIDVGKVLEQDWVVKTVTHASTADSGWAYNLVGDITQIGNYMLVTYARADSGTVSVKALVYKDGSPVGSAVNKTLTTTWQRIEVPTTAFAASLGTTRQLRLVGNGVQASKTFYSDGLHFVSYVRRLTRDFDAGTFTVPLAYAYQDPAAGILADVVDSEPGLLFCEAGGDLRFVDRNGRPSSKPSVAVLGDGNGLLLFERLTYRRDAFDRVDKVIVRSRGTPTLAGGPVQVWEMAPRRTMVTGEKFAARYTQPVKSAKATIKASTMNHSKSYGLGHDIEITAGYADSYIVIEGIPWGYPTESSYVERQVDPGGVVTGPPIEVQMPLQGTSSADMETEAQRLIDKYKNQVFRSALTLNQRSDEITLWQLGLELNTPIRVRAKYLTHSPGVDKRCWVEGIEHVITPRMSMTTVVHLEEA